MSAPTDKEEKKNRVEEFIANPRKAVWKLAVPIMFGMPVKTLYSIVDMIFIGWLSGDAIAALTFNMPLVFFVQFLHERPQFTEELLDVLAAGIVLLNHPLELLDVIQS